MSPAPGEAGRLVVCPTPIGNLEDVTLRVLRALAEADVVACEDTRRTRTLLERHDIRARLVSFHEHNEDARAAELTQRMRRGAVVALVADAGTPLVADPGFVLLAEALRAGIDVEVLPGPSAVITALVASGLPADRWRFVGFLPRGREALLAIVGGARETIVAFESPRRLLHTLELLAEREAERALAVCRELTKLHEDVRRGRADDLATHFRAHPARGEIVLVIGAAVAAADDGAAQDAVSALEALVSAGARPRAAAAALAKLTGVGANQLYRGLTRRGG
ncbi:MAG TPA: 16S rRNA (cytidine(1402)-2'-O)-methyltransferase [Solirubrobacteraceae bacterium]|nr:16S rRNA (cytidine(1402)-2'-O)-methyltransferase [Solirubrobacteraceae bacterium]